MRSPLAPLPAPLPEARVYAYAEQTRVSLHGLSTPQMPAAPVLDAHALSLVRKEQASYEPLIHRIHRELLINKPRISTLLGSAAMRHAGDVRTEPPQQEAAEAYRARLISSWVREVGPRVNQLHVPAQPKGETIRAGLTRIAREKEFDSQTGNATLRRLLHRAVRLQPQSTRTRSDKAA